MLSIVIYILTIPLGIQVAYANPEQLQGAWQLIHPYSAVTSKADFLENPLASKAPIVEGVSLTGGHYLYKASINIKNMMSMFWILKIPAP